MHGVKWMECLTMTKAQLCIEYWHGPDSGMDSADLIAKDMEGHGSLDNSLEKGVWGPALPSHLLPTWGMENWE